MYALSMCWYISGMRFLRRLYSHSRSRSMMFIVLHIAEASLIVSRSLRLNSGILYYYSNISLSIFDLELGSGLDLDLYLDGHMPVPV